MIEDVPATPRPLAPSKPEAISPNFGRWSKQGAIGDIDGEVSQHTIGPLVESGDSKVMGIFLRWEKKVNGIQ